MNKKSIHDKTILIFLLILAALFLLHSCSGFEQEIIPMSVTVDNVPSFLVINGEIELDSTAWVELGYSEDIDALIDVPRKYEDSAYVFLSTGGGGEPLTFIDKGRYEGNSITGKINETYTLIIEVDNETYTATSTMLQSYGYDTAWVVGGKVSGKEGSFFSYSEQFIINDPSATRDRYLFEWWTNGWHNVLRDWAIDDNRVVNANEGLRLFNVMSDPGANEHVRFRTARIEKMTYDYFNMYEKIVRGLVGVGSQTPYNPVSNFGKGTIGNFRAVSFSDYYLLTPPPVDYQRSDQANELSWVEANKDFVKFHLYWDTKPNVTTQSNVISDIATTTYVHSSLTNGVAYYYRLQVVDALGYRSPLAPEVCLTPTDSVLPPDFSASGDSAAVTLSWIPHQKAIKHSIYWDTKTGVTKQSNVIPDLTGTSYTHTNLINGTSYYYRIAGIDSLGNVSELSYEVRATAGGNGPQNVTATPGTGQIALSWDALDGALSYAIYGDTLPGISDKSNQIVKLTTTSYTHASLTTGTTYYYKVGAWVFGGKDYKLLLSREVSAVVGK